MSVGSVTSPCGCIHHDGRQFVSVGLTLQPPLFVPCNTVEKIFGSIAERLSTESRPCKITDVGIFKLGCKLAEYNPEKADLCFQQLFNEIGLDISLETVIAVKIRETTQRDRCLDADDSKGEPVVESPEKMNLNEKSDQSSSS